MDRTDLILMEGSGRMTSMDGKIQMSCYLDNKKVKKFDKWWKKQGYRSRSAALKALIEAVS